MSVEIRSGDRRRYMNELQAREKEIAAGLLKAAQPSSPKVLQENEKRMRREIANSNERRRMQCINAGFSSLRALIPQLEGEKLSKAAILQHTTEYITNLEKEKVRLQAQLEHTKRLLTELGQDRAVAEPYLSTSPPPTKRKKRDTESSDEGVGMLSDASDEGGSELQNENISLRHQLETQKQQYAALEDRNRLLEAQLLSLLQVQANHSSSTATLPSELHPVTLESRHLQHTNVYNRELANVKLSKDNLSSSVDMYQPPRPMSPTPERGMSMDISSRVDSISPDITAASSHCVIAEKDQPVSYALKIETVFSDGCNKESLLSTTASAIDTTLNNANTDQHSYHHNYCHRDHPRRRHRQQAQLDQQRQENAKQQQDQGNMTVPTAYRPKHNTQNLENLVEAIRQIEGDRILCDDQKFYESAQIKYEKHMSIAHSEESEKETSCVSDQEELKSESSGHDSPPLHHHHEHHFQHLFGSVLDHHQNSAGATNQLRNIGNSSSEKYPIATHLLHRPVHDSYYRPGVIVQKQ